VVGAVDYPTGRVLAGLPRSGAFAMVAACYAGTAAVAVATGVGLRGQHPVMVALVADLAGTVTVFAFSMALANSSLYDPYWSMAPPVVAIYWLSVAPAELPVGVRVRQVVVVAAVVVWSVRLTGNWASTWRGLGHEDWRYVQLRAQTAGRLPWWLVSLTGVQLMPTAVVFLALLPLWPVLGVGGRRLGVLDLVGLVCIATAIGVEAVADAQLHRFIADPGSGSRVADRGLWAWSRHPNYLGEIGFWWGLWLVCLAAAPSWWWTVLGPLVVVLLFQAASIPLMERRLTERHRGYANHAARVPRLLPVPRGRPHRRQAR
jgi:steroid 5-alpha reductase family enzyme